MKKSMSNKTTNQKGGRNCEIVKNDFDIEKIMEEAQNMNWSDFWHFYLSFFILIFNFANNWVIRTT